MANQKRQRQRARRAAANPYSTSPAENPYATPAHVPGTSNDAPTPDQVVPGMGDDQGDGTPPGQFPNAGRNGTAMATLNKVALHCFGCGAEGWVGLDKIARIGEGGKQLTCQVCKSTDLDVLDRDPVVSARQRQAMQRTAAPYDRCSECGAEESNWGGLCSSCREAYEDEAGEDDHPEREYIDQKERDNWERGAYGSLHTRRLARLVSAAQTPEQGTQDGQAAFRAGKPRLVPQAEDGTPVGSGWAEYAKAWYRGWDQANLAAPVEASRRTAAQRCDNCGHTIKSNVPNEQGWECPKCHQGSMQDTKESVRTAADAKTCEQCHAKPAEGYAMGPKSGDWGGNYCASCAEKLGWPLQPYQKESALDRAAHTQTFGGPPRFAFTEPPMGHLTSNPTPEEIMAKADAIPLPIKRLPPRQQQETAQVVSAILSTNPGLNRTLAWKVAFRTVTGLDA